MEGRYSIAIVFDYGSNTTKIRSAEQGSRTVVLRAIAEGRKASALGAKVTLVVRCPDGSESTHAYVGGQAI
jgi:hypothetical protein